MVNRAKRFSLIVATLNRRGELEELLSSISQQDFDLSTVEVIIVDQNRTLDLVPLIAPFRSRLIICHLRSDKVGLSLNRNIGLEVAKGEILAFPDDDCVYYPNTLSSVERVFTDNPDVALLTGRVYDRRRAENVIREWPRKPKRLTLYNFLTCYASITLFSKVKVPFDEDLGVGARYGSYEDADYVARVVKDRRSVLYHPAIEVCHPPLNIAVMPSAKVIGYGMGFGALCRKHFGAALGGAFVAALAVHFGGLVVAVFRLNFEDARKRLLAINSRVKGFVRYKASVG